MRLILCLLLTAVVSGASAGDYRPFTEGEKQLFGYAIVGHCLDVITTEIALSDPDMVEGNPIVRDLIVDHEVEFMAIKAAMLGGTYLVAHSISDPKWRRSILKSSIVAGYGPALWNLGLMWRF